MKTQNKPINHGVRRRNSMAEATAFGNLMYFALANPDHPFVKRIVEEQKDEIDEILKDITPAKITANNS